LEFLKEKLFLDFFFQKILQIIFHYLSESKKFFSSSFHHLSSAKVQIRVQEFSQKSDFSKLILKKYLMENDEKNFNKVISSPEQISKKKLFH